MMLENKMIRYFSPYMRNKASTQNLKQRLQVIVYETHN